MPQGRCSAYSGSDFPMSGSGRMAEVTVQVRGVERKINLAGMAEAHFPSLEPQDNNALRPGQTLNMIWNDAVFHGRDRLLGNITAAIPRGSVSSGTVRSLQSADIANRTDTTDFFPAENINQFNFELSIPRFGLQMSSKKQVVNQSTIKEIPPHGSIYKLREPVQFDSTPSRSNGLFAAATGPVVITECNIKLLVVGGIELLIEVDHDDGEHVIFKATALNVSTSDSIEIAWFVWPRPEDETALTMGALRLDRTPKEFKAKLPRDIFYTRRWLVVSGAKPFELDEASAAIRFPALD